jgi:hypothetical protein
MSVSNAEQWKSIEDQFPELWNLLNCAGLLDSKHIWIKKIPGN